MALLNRTLPLIWRVRCCLGLSFIPVVLSSFSSFSGLAANKKWCRVGEVSMTFMEMRSAIIMSTSPCRRVGLIVATGISVELEVLVLFLYLLHSCGEQLAGGLLGIQTDLFSVGLRGLLLTSLSIFLLLLRPGCGMNISRSLVTYTTPVSLASPTVVRLLVKAWINTSLGCRIGSGAACSVCGEYVSGGDLTSLWWRVLAWRHRSWRLLLLDRPGILGYHWLPTPGFWVMKKFIDRKRHREDVWLKDKRVCKAITGVSTVWRWVWPVSRGSRWLVNLYLKRTNSNKIKDLQMLLRLRRKCLFLSPQSKEGLFSWQMLWEKKIKIRIIKLVIIKLGI